MLWRIILFDGISCGMVAAERAGLKIDNYYAYEIDQNAIKISKKNYPNIVHCGDVITEDVNTHEMLKRVYSKNFKCPTLTCVHGGYQQKKVYINGRCRKLTPVEYERLQTLPDNYTAGVSDTARYTAVGNGWTVDVIAYILKNIADNS